MKLSKTYVPKAFNGDRVYVHNYKKKKKDPETGYLVDAGVWEWGVVYSVSTGWHKDPETGKVTFSHHFDVVLDREVMNKYKEWNKSLRLTVGSDQIQTETGY